MTVMTDADAPAAPDLNPGLHLNLEPVVESPEEKEVEELPWGNDPATAAWAPMMAEVSLALLIPTRETDAFPDLWTQLALSLACGPPHWQPRPSGLKHIQRCMSSVEEEQRTIWESLLIPINNR